MIEEIEFVPDRLNEEPVVMLGMTHSEIKTVGVGAMLFWMPVMCVVGGSLGAALFGIGIGALCGFGTIYVIGKQLRVLKRGRPKGYHVMAIQAWLEDHNLKAKTMIRHSQSWGIRRNRMMKGKWGGMHGALR